MNSESDDLGDSESSDNLTIINDSSDSLGPTELIDVPTNVMKEVTNDLTIQHDVTNDVLPLLDDSSLEQTGNKKKRRNGLKLFVSAMDTNKVRV